MQKSVIKTKIMFLKGKMKVMSAANEKKFDLTEGPILNKLLLVAVPIMGTQMMQMAYNLTDMFWLGRVGSVAVAASGTAGMYLWLSQAFLMIGRMGAEIGVSQSLGRRDKKTACTYAQNALFLAAVLGIIFAALMIAFRNPLIGFFQIKDHEVVSQSVVYLVITSLGIPATFISGMVTGTFNAFGNSKIPFFINGTGLIINMVLDPLLIFTFDMGIAGAAIATILAQIIVAVLFLVSMKVVKNRPFEKFDIIAKPDSKVIKQIFAWSIPIALESMFFTMLSMIISRFVAAFGTSAMAAQRVGSQVESLSWLIGGGFASAVTAFMGQNFGANKWKRIHKGYRISSQAMLIWGGFITVVLLLGGQALIGAFLSDPEAVKMGASYLKILAVCQIVACLEYNSAGAFRGIGKTIPPSLVSIASNAMRIPLIYVLSNTSLGLDGIWWGITIGSVVRSLWMLGWYVAMARKMPKEDVL